jgi:hypothetical protein
MTSGSFCLTFFVLLVVTCQDQSSSDSICLNTAGRVTAYGSSIPDTFSDDLIAAAQAADFSGDVDGLQQVSTVTAKAGGDPVAEGSGIGNTDDRTGGGGDAVISEPKSNVSPTDGAISAGAAVGIALAALVVLLCAMFALRNGRRRGYDRRDAALKLATNTEDEDDLVFGGDGSGGEGSVPDDEDDRIPGTRKVHVLGEEDSLVTASHSVYRDRNVEIRPVRVPYDESNDRHSSIKFVATAGARVGPTIPPDASRTYAADDTVLL